MEFLTQIIPFVFDKWKDTKQRSITEITIKRDNKTNVFFDGLIKKQLNKEETSKLVDILFPGIDIDSMNAVASLYKSFLGLDVNLWKDVRSFQPAVSILSGFHHAFQPRRLALLIKNGTIKKDTMILTFSAPHHKDKKQIEMYYFIIEYMQSIYGDWGLVYQKIN